MRPQATTSQQRTEYGRLPMSNNRENNHYVKAVIRGNNLSVQPRASIGSREMSDIRVETQVGSIPASDSGKPSQIHHPRQTSRILPTSRQDVDGSSQSWCEPLKCCDPLIKATEPSAQHSVHTGGVWVLCLFGCLLQYELSSYPGLQSRFLPELNEK